MARGHGFPRCMRGLPLARIIRDQWIMRAILMTCLGIPVHTRSTLLIACRFNFALSWNISKCIGYLEAQPPKLRTLETNPGYTRLRSRRGWMYGPCKQEVFGHERIEGHGKKTFHFKGCRKGALKYLRACPRQSPFTLLEGQERCGEGPRTLEESP